MSNIATSAPKLFSKEAESKPAPFIPAPPNSLEEAGISEGLVEQLVLKNLYFRGEVSGRDLSKVIGLRFSVIEPVLEFLKRARLVEVKRSSSIGSISSLFQLSEAGRARAKEYLENNQFLGPAPVPLNQYVEAVRRQKIKAGWLTKEVLCKAFTEAVVTDDFYSKLGPAVNSFKSLLIYGKPGNGKSYLSEQLARLDSDPVFIPYVIQAEGQFVKVFDSLYHEKLEADDESIFVTSEAQYDPRWAKCKRPYLTTGGELTMEMLDLMHIPAAKIYDAPYQLKANNGIYLIDDFGRQQITPAELLNRWIYPLDRSVDYLSFQTGTKIQVPFECFLIFSSNLNPNDLGDEAFLRRLEYKLFMRNPSEEEFATIFYDYCRNMKIESPSGLVMDVIKDHYNSTGRKFRRCHPRDVIRIAIDLLRFENLPFVLTKELIDRAFELKFVAMNYTDE
jgi:predicted ATPase with chaperone activity